MVSSGTDHTKPRAGGSRLEISFRGGSASLAMAGADLAVTLHEQGQAVRHFVLMLDWFLLALPAPGDCQLPGTGVLRAFAVHA